MSRTKHCYATIANCNFEAKDEITLARKAVEQSKLTDADLIDALDALEETLEKYADNGYAHAVEACRKAEAAVRKAYAVAIENATDDE